VNSNRVWAVLASAWLWWGASSLWAAEKDAWGVELDAGGVAALGSSDVRSEGKSGFSAGGLVRYGGNRGWSRGLGYNIALSRKRANTVRDFFVTRWEINANRFTIFAHGAKDPAASNATPRGRAKNRRVLVLIIP
jgi:hypothetical protein